MTIYLASLVLVTAISGTLANTRLGDQGKVVKSILIEGFEWFGELGIFCLRVFRAALSPPYEIRELVRQCDAIGAKSLPLVANRRRPNSLPSLRLSDPFSRRACEPTAVARRQGSTP